MRAARTDANQQQVVGDLRVLGFSVAVTSALGNGFPDLVVGYRDAAGDERNLLVELKDGDKPPSKQVLTADEFRFREKWAGRIITARTVDEIVSECRGRYAPPGQGNDSIRDTEPEGA